MVETKDSAALFLPSTEALSHGRTARRIGRVRSHKRSLRNQFHLFVNTREDFHSPGGIPPQDYLSLSLALCQSLFRSFSLRLPSVHFITSQRELESPLSSLARKFRREFANTSRFTRSSLLFRLKTIERGASRKSESETSLRPANWLVAAYRKSAGLVSSPPLFRSFITPAFGQANASYPPVARKDIISFSALWALCFADYSRLRRFTLRDSVPRKGLFRSLSRYSHRWLPKRPKRWRK